MFKGCFIMYIKENENKTVVSVNDCKSIVKDTLQKLFINDYKTVEVSEKEVLLRRCKR